MATGTTKKTAPKPAAAKPAAATKKAVVDVDGAVTLLRACASADVKAGMGRFGIDDDTAIGVGMKEIQRIAKDVGRDHALAMGLWKTGIYEARMLAAFVADAGALTVSEMNAWARDFDSWAVCDNACFHLFDRSPHAVGRVEAWVSRDAEFVRRAGFALLASLALHRNKGSASDDDVRALMPLIERHADDDRNFVKKAMSWALRSCLRRPALRPEVLAMATRLKARPERAARFVATETLRALRSA